MTDVQGFELTADERRRLVHEAVGGVVLFRRNYRSREQITALVAEIKALRTPELIVAVDHEGGRVQRFIDGFTRLPAMRTLGTIFDTEGEDAAKAAAETVGRVLATELRACGIDLSFAPVLDLDWDVCAVIGNRSFHRRADVTAMLALALQRGLHRGGMASCGKHFPGHGCVAGDSHFTLPEDGRSMDELWADDIAPFRDMIAAGMQSVMPAHVLYPQVDTKHPAGFSKVWLQDVLRGRLKFDGLIFSDDLMMEGANTGGSIKERTLLAAQAGCDVLLVCNHPDKAEEAAEALSPVRHSEMLAERWQMVAGKGSAGEYRTLMQTPEFAEAQQFVSALASPDDVRGGVKVGEQF